ncbi:ornithine cyclodeaminase family protein [Glaciibacter superstes]|uniref:ornithine cyclodeaminase family protein n=1 Tax=Glaciibacter superstes TaxID=501023 RepID=UPI0003B4C1ED|nr:ornithine cyclodeaminase family protein [Glaciibacter superstes]
MTRYLDDDIVASELSAQDAFACVERAFRLLADGSATNAVRQRSQMGTAVINVMWALAPTEGVMGVKAYPVVRTDVSQGSVLTFLLYAIDTGELLAVMKADRLSQIRTGAATAVATRAMARPDAEVLSVYGAGLQAETQIRALVSALPNLRSVRVVGRSVERRDAFITRMRRELGVDVRADEPESAARAADVIVTVTGSAAPVIRGSWLKAGTHVNAVGSNMATKREVDREVLERAALIVVDDREVAQVECGDLIANGWDPSSVGTIGELLSNRIPGRMSPEDITVFESQGLALQDVVCGALVVKRATEKGFGLRIS